MEVYTRLFGGIDKLFTAFFTSVYHDKKLKRRVHDLEKREFHRTPVVPQILSKDAGELIRFAKICRRHGYDEINWNLGCPFPRVANKQRGSGLLPYPEKVSEILDAVMPEIPIRLSIKCRLGYRNEQEIMQLIPVFNRYPLSEVIIHARIGKQLYKGNVHTGFFEKAAETSKIPAGYNGDIFTADDFYVFRERFRGVTRWMIGRGVLCDPFLPLDIRGSGTSGKRTPMVNRYVNELYYGYRKAMNDRLQALNRMKELWSYLALSFNHPVKVFGLIKKAKSFDDYEYAVSRVFSDFLWEGAGGKRLADSDN